jgi:hypothetical protein
LLWKHGNLRKFTLTLIPSPSGRGEKVPEQARFDQARFATLGQLDGKQTFVDHLPQPIDHACPVKVKARRLVMVE